MDLFYSRDEDLLELLIKIIKNTDSVDKKRNVLSHYIYKKYNWDTISKKYDKTFELLFS